MRHQTLDLRSLGANSGRSEAHSDSSRDGSRIPWPFLQMGTLAASRLVEERPLLEERRQGHIRRVVPIGAAAVGLAILLTFFLKEAILLTFFLKEIGPAIRLPENVTARGSHGSNTWNGEIRSATR